MVEGASETEEVQGGFLEEVAFELGLGSWDKIAHRWSWGESWSLQRVEDELEVGGWGSTVEDGREGLYTVLGAWENPLCRGLG